METRKCTLEWTCAQHRLLMCEFGLYHWSADQETAHDAKRWTKRPFAEFLMQTDHTAVYVDSIDSHVVMLGAWIEDQRVMFFEIEKCHQYMAQ